MKLRALEDVVFIEPLEVGPDTGKIVLPDQFKDTSHFGKVVAIGYKLLRDGTKIPCVEGLAVGDTVYYSRAGMWEWNFNGKPVVFGKPGYLQCVIEGKAEAKLEDRSMKSYL